MKVRKLGKREMYRAVLENAAAMVNDADFSELFGDDFADEISGSEANEDVAEEARRKVVAKLRKMAGASTNHL